VNNHHLIEEAVIEAFCVTHEGHTQEVEVQRGTWSIYCLCKRCGEIQTYEVYNEVRQQTLGLPLWQEEDNEEALACVLTTRGFAMSFMSIAKPLACCLRGLKRPS
jgi:hypothetical protein